jgi:hypothetical protein
VVLGLCDQCDGFGVGHLNYDGSFSVDTDGDRLISKEDADRIAADWKLSNANDDGFTGAVLGEN